MALSGAILHFCPMNAAKRVQYASYQKTFADKAAALSLMC